MKVVLLTLVLALAMGCTSPAPSPTATPLPYLAFQLDVRISPNDAATFMLNPSPLGKGGYAQGMVVTIEILPDEGWEVDEWVGPVFNIDGTTAQIEMVSSQSVAVRLKLTIPPTATPNPKPSATRSGFTYAPPREGADRGGGRDARVIQPTATRGPKPLVGPTARPIPTPTQVPWTKVPTSTSFVTTASGLGIKTLVVGIGDHAEPGDTAVVHYTGWLLDGTKFDSSVDRGTPFEFPLGAGRVIRGWDEGVATMNVGGKVKLIIPPDLAYGVSGASGVIPPDATLIFEVELLDLK